MLIRGSYSLSTMGRALYSLSNSCVAVSMWVDCMRKSGHR